MQAPGSVRASPFQMMQETDKKQATFLPPID